jgi:serine/threonine protein phosphatase PrpC
MLAVGAAAAVLFACIALLLAPLTVSAAPHAAHPAAATPSRPPQAVAYARIGVVRVLTYYNGTVSSDPAPIPVPTACIADGVIVGTTGNGLNTFNYVLVPTAAVNPITPCRGAQAAFTQLNGNATGWSISHVDVLLDAAYTGTSASQLGSIAFTIDPGQIKTNGGPSAPALLALALVPAPGAHASAHDLPVLATPQPSDPPATGTPQVLDLTGVDGTPLARDSMPGVEAASALYPISLPADQLAALPQATSTLPSTVSPPQQTVVGGTAAPSAPPQVPTQAVSTPAPLSAQVALGAPMLDSNGRLVGMVVPDARGNHALAGLSAVTRALEGVTGRPGPLMMQWQQGLSAFYDDSPTRFDTAAATFADLATAYPDFGGVAPFASAAQAHSTTIPSLTHSNPVAPLTAATGPSPLLLLLASAAAMLLLLFIGLSLVLMRRTRTRRAAQAARVTSQAAAATAPIADLDLLPPDVPLEELDALLENETTMPLPAIGARVPGFDGEASRPLPAVAPALMRVRQGLALMPHAAGLTDAGVKRAANPNQDSILVVQGTRRAAGRVQPFGLFIVADGMGGHMHGQEASRLAIEIVTSLVLQELRTSHPLPESLLKDLMRESVHKAGDELCRRNREERADMGTTLTAALTVDDIAYVANIGDSRTYLMSPETGLHQLTTDHSVVANLVAHGVIRPEDIYTHPRRNQIYRSLGGDHEQVDVDLFEVPLQAGDKLLLCSDGLWEMVRNPQIAHILRGTADPQQAVELLVREANANGGEDNISAVVVRMLDDVPQEAEAGLHIITAPEPAQPSEAVGDHAFQG